MRRAVWCLGTALLCVAAAGTANAQPSDKTAALARQFVEAMKPRAEGYAPRYIAASHPTDDDRFVAAMVIPDVQLLIVEADYAVPVLLRERLLTGKFREAYLDLSTATDEATRLTIEDIQADGLAPEPARGIAAGDVVIRAARTVTFDGDWRKQKIGRDDYQQAFSRAEADYVRILELLLEQVK